MGHAARSLGAGLVLVAGACASFSGEGSEAEDPVDPGIAEGGVSEGGTAEAGAPTPRCPPTGRFIATHAVAGLEHATSSNGSATLTTDELTVVFASSRDRPSGFRLYSATRADRGNAFSTPAPLDGIGEALPNPNSPFLSGDGLALYFAAVPSSWDVYRASRARPTDLFGNVTRVGAIDSDVTNELDPFAANGGSELWFTSSRTADGGNGTTYHLHRSRFAGASFLPPERVLPADEDDQRCPVLSSDLRTLFLARSTPGVSDGRPLVVMARRDSPEAAFTTFAAVEELNVSPQQYPSWLSPDECRLYYTRVMEGPGARAELWVAERTPLPSLQQLSPTLQKRVSARHATPVWT